MSLADYLQSLEERLLDPGIRRGGPGLEDLLAPGFVEFGSSGRVFNRAQIVADLAAEPPDTRITLTDFHLLAHADDWALVTYQSTRLSPTGAPTRTALRSSTWIKRGERWQILFHQGTVRPS